MEQSASTTPSVPENLSKSRFWAKAGKSRNAHHHHPVICHLMDTAAVAKRISLHHLSRPAFLKLKQGLGFQSDAACVTWVAFFAGSHDLGKISPAFQFQIPAIGRALTGEAYYQAWCRQARFAEPVAHGLITAARLPEYLTTNLSIEESLAIRISLLVGGHHGFFPSAMELEDLSTSQVGKQAWQTFRRELLDDLAAYVGVTAALERPTRCDAAAGMLLAGLTTISDWIASSEECFPYIPDAEAAGYSNGLDAKAAQALDRLGWRSVPPLEPLGFAALFPEIAEPRPLQVAVARAAQAVTPPAMLLVEAAMGEGKTEAALAAADHFQHHAGAMGFYVGLPTQATSNQMWARTGRFLEGRYPGAVNLPLSHSQAMLRGEYLETVCRLDQVYDSEARVVASEWHTARKRSLLSPFGVGTLDQGLMGVVRSRHQFVRLFGLAGRTVILDEVHAYDLYTGTLIERMLEWLAVLGSPVIALSATLPTTLRERLAGAYARGLGVPAPAMTQVDYPRVTMVDAHGCRPEHFDASGHVTRALSLVWRDEDDWLAGVVEAVAAGANVAVLCSTVGRAQAIYTALARSIDASRRDLFHARYLMVDREAIEQRNIARFGKTGERPRGFVLVATQVIEQSLDLDFDLMVSDLAPIDLLLQRSGRIHRHNRPADRRGGFASPTLWVIRPTAGPDGRLDLGAAGIVYDNHLLLRTWWRLRGVTEIALPATIDPLIEAVYDPHQQPFADLTEAETALWRTTRAQSEIDNESRLHKARGACVPPPASNAEPEEYTRFRLEDEETTLQALTRLGTESLTAIVLREVASGWATVRGTTVVQPSQAPNRKQLQDLMQHAIRINQRALVQALKKVRRPEGWTTGVLRPCVPIVLDADGTCEIGGWKVRLDDELGLVYERK